MPIAVVFPGQGSQSVGMLSEAAEQWSIVGKTFDEASEVLGYNLWKVCQEGPQESLNRTDITQPALLASSVALWRVWNELGGPEPGFLAGHSLGEYSALVAAGSIGFADAVELVRVRGEAMLGAVPSGDGRMAAILGLDDERIIAICQDHVADGVVEAVNFNAPGQVVIAGGRAAVDKVADACREAGAKRVMPLDVSVPSHCALMQPAADRMAGALAGCSVSDAAIPVVQNVSAAAVTDANMIRENLYWQLISPVRWTDSVRYMAEQGVTAMAESGPGKVLSGLARRIDRNLGCFPTETPAQMESALEGCR
ncbi:[acyl-carrier-protein] S-malonyltransferase [Halospina denitrificans]|uniref:Malonyl CoA-acyl carrier protein transacylase n=1 Tax=Halospina denitrificans TaxID=332522 RepID=A0A4R7JNR1_9GAMM|nr:ACP S-malonyltransferase [Halospina denitrificans]TDT39364.1 [acyl-carrier-protein] S-malonyltransferase [Halospina denitrificans]